MSHLICLLRMSEECLRMHAPIILQKPFITNVLQGMVASTSSLFFLPFPTLITCIVTYIRLFFCRLEAHFHSKVTAGLQSGSKIQ